MSSRGLKYNFSIGELVLCFEPDPTKAKVLYDAKVLDLQSLRDKDGKKIAGYHIHFQGWNSSWDRIVSEEFILRGNETNRLLMKKLSDAAKKNQSKDNRKRKIDHLLKRVLSNEEASDVDDDDDDDDYSSSKLDDSDDDESNASEENQRKTPEPELLPEPKQPTHDPVSITLPDMLKHKMEEDFHLINHKEKVINLPVKCNVVDILQSFVKSYCLNLLSEPQEREKSRSNSSDSWHHAPGRWIPLCKEMVDGMRICFDFTLPVILLYGREKDQYDKIKNVPIESLKQSESTTSSSQPESKKPKIQSPPRPSHSHHSDDDSSSDELTPRRITRRSIHEETPRSNPRGRRTGQRSRRVVSSPPEVQIKTEPNSDNEISFNVQSVNQNFFNAHLTSTNGNGIHHPEVKDDVKSEMIDNLLSWQLLPEEVKTKGPVQPSQIYGIQHLLRLFVKLPDLINKMNIDQIRTDILMKLIDCCLQYLCERDDLFVEESYTET